MAKTYTFTFEDEDLAAMRSAQKLINDVIDLDLPLEVLVPIAVRSVHAHTLAIHVAGTVTGDERVVQEALAKR
jgi:hypothetical protein